MSLLSWVGQEGAVWHHLSAHRTTGLEATLQSPEYSKELIWLTPQRTCGHLPYNPKLWIGYWGDRKNSVRLFWHLFWPRLLFHRQNAVTPSASSLSCWSLTQCGTPSKCSASICWVIGGSFILAKSVLLKLMTVTLFSLHKSQIHKSFFSTKIAPVQKWNN